MWTFADILEKVTRDESARRSRKEYGAVSGLRLLDFYLQAYWMARLYSANQTTVIVSTVVSGSKTSITHPIEQYEAMGSGVASWRKSEQPKTFMKASILLLFPYFVVFNSFIHSLSFLFLLFISLFFSFGVHIPTKYPSLKRLVGKARMYKRYPSNYRTLGTRILVTEG